MVDSKYEDVRISPIINPEEKKREDPQWTTTKNVFGEYIANTKLGKFLNQFSTKVILKSVLKNLNLYFFFILGLSLFVNKLKTELKIQ